MKWAVTLLGCLGCCLGSCLSAAAGAELTAGRTVFLMPLSHGLDQFVANRLIRMHVLRVVTDPAKADSIITDQVGTGFEDRMNDLYPPPAPDTKRAAKEKAADTPPERGLGSMLGDTVNKPEKAGSMGLYGRGRGTIFLVDVQSRQVLWSAFEKPKNSSPRELDHTAERIVKRLKEDLAAKAK